MRDAAPRPVLKPVELRVMRHLAGGLTLRETAQELHYSYGYARKVVAAALGTLGARTLAQGIARAVRAELL